MSALGGKADIGCPLFESEAFLRHQCLLSGVKRTLDGRPQRVRFYRAGQNISINEDTGFGYLTGVTQDGIEQNATVGRMVEPTRKDPRRGPLVPEQFGLCDLACPAAYVRL